MWRSGVFYRSRTRLVRRSFALFALAGLLLGMGNCPRIVVEPRLHNPYQHHPHWYKGQIHAHSNRAGDDGDNSARDVLVAYLDADYHFLALTGHDQSCSNIFSHPLDVNGGGIGIYIPSEEDCNFERRGHLLALGLTRRQSPCGPLCAWDDQRRIDHVVDQGGIAVLAHPIDGGHNWGVGNDLNRVEEHLSSLQSFHGIVIDNSQKEVELWDRLLDRGKRIWGFADDDCHDVEGRAFNRAWIMVNSRLGPPRTYMEGPGILQQNDVIDDLKTNISEGNFYAVVRDPHRTGHIQGSDTGDAGPQLAIRVLAGLVSVDTDRPCNRIEFIGGPGEVLKTVRNLQSASYTLQGGEEYVRVFVEQERDGELYWAYSQPLFVIPPS